MKKYFISVLIPYLLLQFSGCYSMQEVTKEEFSPAPDYPELIVKTKAKKYAFEEGNYIFTNDTIYGRGEFTLLENPFKPFVGTISTKNVYDMQMNNSDNNSEITELIIKTMDKEFIFNYELSSYSVRNDTIYGKGKYRPRYDKNQFQGNISLNDVEEIQVNKFNLTATILWSSLAVFTVTLIILMATSFKLDISEEDIWRGIGNNLQ